MFSSIFGRMFTRTTCENCPVCLEKLTKNNNYCSTICGHNFHTSCLLKTNGNCPLCRKVLIEEELGLETKEDVENTGTSIDFNFYNTQVNGGPVGGGTSIDFYTSGNTQIQRILSKMKYQDSVQFALDEIDKFYTMKETPEHYGYRQLIENVRIAYAEKNISSLKNIARDFYSSKIDPEHPTVVVEYDLVRAFDKLVKELEKDV